MAGLDSKLDDRVIVNVDVGVSASIIGNGSGNGDGDGSRAALIWDEVGGRLTGSLTGSAGLGVDVVTGHSVDGRE